MIAIKQSILIVDGTPANLLLLERMVTQQRLPSEAGSQR